MRAIVLRGAADRKTTGAAMNIASNSWSIGSRCETLAPADRRAPMAVFVSACVSAQSRFTIKGQPMTPQEREPLSSLLQQMTQTQVGQKHAEADALIREAAARQPDATYLLVQRAMGLEYALQVTQAQVSR
jgi:hypothetical protein